MLRTVEGRIVSCLHVNIEGFGVSAHANFGHLFRIRGDRYLPQKNKQLSVQAKTNAPPTPKGGSESLTVGCKTVLITSVKFQFPSPLIFFENTYIKNLETH